MKNSRAIIIVLAVLLLLALIGVGYFWTQTSNLKGTVQELNEEVSTLDELRTALLEDIDGLQTDIEGLQLDNDSIAYIVEEAKTTIQTQRAQIEQIKRDFARDAKGMKAEIEQLKKIKQELATVVEQLQAENVELTESNRILNEEVTVAQEQNVQLSGEVSQLEKNLKATEAESARADNFQIEAFKKSGKSTTNPKRAKEITVSFDIKKFPDDMIGEHTVYLTLSDGNGTPIEVANPVKATIRPSIGGDAIQIIAQKAQDMFLENGKRIEITVEPLEKLAPGDYKAAVYVDWAMLGSSAIYMK